MYTLNYSACSGETDGKIGQELMSFHSNVNKTRPNQQTLKSARYNSKKPPNSTYVKQRGKNPVSKSHF
jgi:hypothetical protein